MSSEPNPPTGPIPAPRPRPDAPSESNEEELWDLEDLPTPTTRVVPVTRSKPDLSSPPSHSGKAVEPLPRQVGHTRIQPSVRRKGPFGDDVHRPAGLNDMGELDTNWEDTPRPPKEPEIPEKQPVFKTATPPSAPSPTPEPATEPTEATAAAPVEPAIEAAPTAEKSVSRSPLSLLEKTGLILLGVMLLGAATAFVIVSAKKLPQDQSKSDAADFPVKGTRVTVTQVATYWRVPTDQDRVRRETKLIPVIQLQVEGGPAGLRFFFRNAQHEVVGDSVTRSAHTGTLEVAATSGFEADGMHAAYRTGEGKPWKVEVFEAPTEDSERKEFTKLLETPISSDLR